MAIVLQANKDSSELGGTSRATSRPPRCTRSASTISGTRRPTRMAATSSTSRDIPRRASTRAPISKGRLGEDRLRRFRQETDDRGHCRRRRPVRRTRTLGSCPTSGSSRPCRWPRPLMAIYQARFMKYLQGRGLAATEQRKVWAFLGDGECDEPEVARRALARCARAAGQSWSSSSTATCSG